MSFTYVYPVATAIPGGNFVTDNLSYLTSLIREHIATPLKITSVTSLLSGVYSLYLTFPNQLSPAEKTILDNDSITPAGGLVAQSVHHFLVSINDTLIKNFGYVRLLGDGVDSLTVTVTLVDGYENAILGNPAALVVTSPAGVLPINFSHGNLDPTNGSFTFQILPTASRLRGQRSIIIGSDGIPSRYFYILIM